MRAYADVSAQQGVPICKNIVAACLSFYLHPDARPMAAQRTGQNRGMPNFTHRLHPRCYLLKVRLPYCANWLNLSICKKKEQDDQA